MDQGYNVAIFDYASVRSIVIEEAIYSLRSFTRMPSNLLAKRSTQFR